MIIEMAILNFCASQVNINTEACVKATTATFMQAGVYDQINNAERQSTAYIETEVTGVTGKEIWAVGFFTYNTYKNKSIKYEFRTKKYLPVDSIKPVISLDSGMIEFRWNF